MREVLRRIVPSKKDYEEMARVCQELLRTIRAETAKVDGRIEALLLGSISRDTWLSYEKDIDVFLRFPEEYPKPRLEEVVTRIGKKVLKGAHKRYAEHPYVKGKFAGHEVEIVPCYGAKDASELRSSVDRTPLHDEFVKRNLKDGRNEVRLLKQFLRGIGCYGAEAKVEGFSGYLCELLVIRYGSFEKVLREASSWGYGARIDLDNGRKGAEFEASPLIFIDPVDRKRNVAKALSEQAFFTFIHAAKAFLKEPNAAFFFPEERRYDKRKLLERYRARGTGLLALSFERADVIEDILYPQLRKAQKLLVGLLGRGDFSVLGSDFEVSKEVTLLFELEALEIPGAKVHLGPPVNSPHEARFLEKYSGFKDKLCEPFIKEGRWQVVVKRRNPSALGLLEEFLTKEGLEERGMPSHVARTIEQGFVLKAGEEVFEKGNLSLLANCLDPRFPWETG